MPRIDNRLQPYSLLTFSAPGPTPPFHHPVRADRFTNFDAGVLKVNLFSWNRVRRWRQVWAPALLLLVISSGCRAVSGFWSRKQSEELQGVVALYPLADPRVPAAGRLFRELPEEFGHSVRVRAFPLVWSGNFYAARSVKVNGKLQFEGYLDPHGKMLWQQVRADRPVDRVAVAVDGVFRFYLQLSPKTTKWDSVSIVGPWRAGELQRVVGNARDNYQAINHGGGKHAVFFP